ncbi:MAG: hypothetical protein HGA25_10475, partial [Clostridiales bacterium]|nr:hypothetical protein [Clostridiales bacterium]
PKLQKSGDDAIKAAELAIKKKTDELNAALLLAKENEERIKLKLTQDAEERLKRLEGMKIEDEDDSDECEHAECRTKFRYDRRTIIEYSTMKIQ